MVRYFGMFCCASILVLAVVEITAHVGRGFGPPELIGIFVGNPIPTGTVSILLLFGPLRLVVQEAGWRRTLGWGLTLLSLTLIVLTQRRGTLLAVFAMLLCWAAVGRSKWAYLCVSVMILAALIVPWRMIPIWGSWNPEFSSPDFTILYRIEAFFFAANVFRHAPWLGIGARSYTYSNYLAEYQLRNPSMVDSFPNEMIRIQTLDNMFLTLLVEFGVLFALAYLSFISYTIYRSLVGRRSGTQLSSTTLVCMLPLVGLAIQSMTYDSLLSPPVNWLFSAQVGILAASSEEGSEDARTAGNCTSR